MHDQKIECRNCHAKYALGRVTRLFLSIAFYTLLPFIFIASFINVHLLLFIPVGVFICVAVYIIFVLALPLKVLEINNA